MNDVYARYSSTVEASNRAEQDVQRIQEQLDDLSEFCFFLRFLLVFFFFIPFIFVMVSVTDNRPSREFFGDVHFPFPFVLALEFSCESIL